ncbi:hypothetical protein KL943_000867 [Ogataea angusta]|nr:hypothetical protein KL943_000867 [Ogataea angusta]
MRLLSAINNWLVLDESDNARNRDIVPIPVHRRRWKLDGFVSYWAISSMCAVTWAGGSSIMYMGLTGGQTMGVIVVGNLLISVSALVNSIYGTKYHIGYSVFQRVVFGVKGSVLVEPVVSEHDEHASRLRPDDDSGADWVHCIPASQRACAHGAPRILLTVPR